ncbi:MAG: hypothetical protein KAI83_00135 [Thiomargarita sp.]|nr:hypothetical protein [Thiomargarita sp.]
MESIRESRFPFFFKKRKPRLKFFEEKLLASNASALAFLESNASALD